MAWRIEFSSAARKDVMALDPQVAPRITGFLRECVAALDDPRAIGEALQGARLGAVWKYRVGDCRVIADIEDQVLRILVVRVGNRREVYR